MEPTREGAHALSLLPIVNEVQARLYLAEKALGGGISELAKVTGVSRTTITKGIKELQSGIGLERGTSIRKGGGGASA